MTLWVGTLSKFVVTKCHTFWDGIALQGGGFWYGVLGLDAFRQRYKCEILSGHIKW